MCLVGQAFFKGESAAVLALIDEHKEAFVGAKVGSARDVCAIGGELVNPTQRSAEVSLSHTDEFSIKLTCTDADTMVLRPPMVHTDEIVNNN